jgi:tetratricopeptide (TPR) repeat protein
MNPKLFNQELTMDQTFLSDALTKQGVVNLQQGDLEAAISLFTQAIHHNPHSVSAYVNRSTAYYSQGNYALALNDLSRSLELVPDHFVFYLNRSIIYNKMGNGDRALADFEAAMRLNPQNFMTHFNQSLLLLPQEPETDYSPPPPTTPTPMKVVRGKLHRNLSKMCVAVYEFCAEMELQPNADTSDQVQSDILELMLRLYQQAIDRDPNNVLLYWDRSCLLIDAQKLEFAIADLLQAIKLAPQNAVLWLNCGIAYYKKLNFPQALSYFSQALTLNPRMIEAYANRAIVYIALNRLSDARVDLDQAMQIAPAQAFLLQLRTSLPLLVD